MLGMRLIYDTLINRVRPDRRIEIDALLGIEGADEKFAEHRKETVSTMGFDVG